MPLGAGVAGRGAPKCLSMQHLGTHILSNRTSPGFDRASKGGYNGVMYLEDHNRDELISLLSDLQKDAWGFRPKDWAVDRLGIEDNVVESWACGCDYISIRRMEVCS